MSMKLTSRRKTMAKKNVSPKPSKPSSHVQGLRLSKNTSFETLEESTQKTPSKCKTTTSLSTRTSPRFATTQNNFQPSHISNDFPHGSYDFNDITLSKLFDEYEENADRAVEKNFADVSSDDFSDDRDDPGYEPELEGSDIEDSNLRDLDLVNEEDVDEVDLDENLIEEDIDDNTDDEELQQARENVKQWNVSVIKIAKQLQTKAFFCSLPSQEKQPQVEMQDGHVSEYDESGEEVDTPGESDDESRPGRRKRSNVIIVDEKTDFEKLEWCVGIRFPNRCIFKDCVVRYAVAQGRNLKFDISEKEKGQRLRVRCIPGCPFKLYGSWEKKRACFVVKSVDPEHTCQRNMESNRQLKSTWVAKQLLEVFKARPHWPASDIIETLRRAYKVIVKKGFAYKAKYHNKRKCPNIDRVQPPTQKKRKGGRPRVGGDNGRSGRGMTETTNTHHDATAQPTRVGRGGRVIRSGRGSRGGARGGSKTSARVSRAKVPQGLGVLIDTQGLAYTNVPGSSSGPTSITLECEGPSTQASTCVPSTQH